jgi:hypothetical protein
VLGSVLSDVPSLLCGMSSSEREGWRHRWQQKHHGDAADRIMRLTKAVDDLETAGTAALKFAISLVDNRVIAEAERSAEALAKAMADDSPAA